MEDDKSEDNLNSIEYFVDEIKNKNFNIRVFNVKKLILLCELLPFERICKELIPFMIDCIYNYENCGEVFSEYAKLIEQIIIYFLNNYDKDSILNPIESLINCYYDKLLYNEDDIVQNDSIQCMYNLIAYAENKSNPKRDVLVHVICKLLDIFQDVNGNNYLNQYSCVYSMCFIIPKLYVLIKENNEKINLYLQALKFLTSCKGDNIRRFSISNIGLIIPLIENNEQNKKLIDILGEMLFWLLNDPNEFVVLNSIETTGIYINKFYPSENIEKLFPKILNILVISPSTMEISWRIKQETIDFVYKVFDKVDNNFIENVFLKFVIFNLKENANLTDSEIKITILLNLDKLLDKNLYDTFTNRILLILYSVTLNEQCYYVREALAKNIGKIVTKILTHNSNQNFLSSNSSQQNVSNINSLLMNIILKLLGDEMSQVSYALVENTTFNKYNIDFYGQFIYEVFKDPYWRIRYEVAKKVDEYITNFVIKEGKELNHMITNYIKIIFLDKANDIRMLGITLILKILNQKFTTGIYIGLINEILNVQEEVLKNQNAKYYLKIFVINTIKELFPFYKKEELKSKIIPVLEKLKNDQISNIQNSTNEMLIFLNENLQ